MNKSAIDVQQSNSACQLIKLSHETGYPIVTVTQEAANEVERQALNMGISIPVPFCYRSGAFADGLLSNMNVLVMDADTMISAILNTKVAGITISDAVKTLDSRT
jgi:hypothetical protein